MNRFYSMAGIASVIALCLFATTPSLKGEDDSQVAGKWTVVFATEDGSLEIQADLKLDGDQVSGKWGDADVKGTFKDGSLDLAFPYTSEEANLTATMKVKAKFKDGKLAGTWEYGSWNGTLELVRPKPAAN